MTYVISNKEALKIFKQVEHKQAKNHNCKLVWSQSPAHTKNLFRNDKTFPMLLSSFMAKGFINVFIFLKSLELQINRDKKKKK